MSQMVTELNIVGSDKNIFDTDLEYVIPLYQRAYAWEDKQLTQLVEDINDVANDASYYIGALIVSKQGMPGWVMEVKMISGTESRKKFRQSPWRTGLHLC